MKFKKLQLGSNQHQKVHKLWLIRFFLIMAFFILAIWLFTKYYESQPEPQIVSPVSAKEVSTSKVTFGHTTTPPIKVIEMIVQEFSEEGSSVVARAIAIANCESKFKEDAYHLNNNGSFDSGVFQINSIHGYSKFQLFAAYENIRIAHKMFIKNGHSFNAWVCAK